MQPKLLLIILLCITCKSIMAQRIYTRRGKGDICLVLQMPYVNYLVLHPNNKFRADQLGFNGEGIGLAYHYANNNFVAATAVLAVTKWLPIPAPITATYSKNMATGYYAITHNNMVGSFSIGYGINYSYNYFSTVYRAFDSISAINLPQSSYYTNECWGITLNTFCRVKKRFNLGIIYKPTFIQNSMFVPEQFVSATLQWDIRMYRGKSNY